MSDKEIIDGLIARDNYITEQVFFVRIRPLLLSIMRSVFYTPVDYDEMVNLLYEYLMSDDCAKLRQFQYRSSIWQWMKVVATRFYIRQRKLLIENVSHEPLYERIDKDEIIDGDELVSNRMSVDQLLELMGNKRYVLTIRRLVLEDMSPEEFAKELGVTVDNLYNIKKRAMASLAQVAAKYYGNER